MISTPSDEIDTASAAALLGIGGAMFRRLCSQGFIPRHSRGKTSVSGAIRGYIEFLKSGAERSDENAASTRAHRAKAAKIERATARRRASLMPREDVEAVVNMTADSAVASLKGVDVVGEVSDATGKAFRKEIGEACGRIEKARKEAIGMLRGEEFEGEADD